MRRGFTGHDPGVPWPRRSPRRTAGRLRGFARREQRQQPPQGGAHLRPDGQRVQEVDRLPPGHAAAGDRVLELQPLPGARRDRRRRLLSQRPRHGPAHGHRRGIRPILHRHHPHLRTGSRIRTGGLPAQSFRSAPHPPGRVGFGCGLRGHRRPGPGGSRPGDTDLLPDLRRRLPGGRHVRLDPPAADRHGTHRHSARRPGLPAAVLPPAPGDQAIGLHFEPVLLARAAPAHAVLHPALCRRHQLPGGHQRPGGAAALGTTGHHRHRRADGRLLRLPDVHLRHRADQHRPAGRRPQPVRHEAGLPPAGGRQPPAPAGTG